MGLGPVAFERAGAVGEAEAGGGGHHGHVGAVVAAIGDQGDARCAGQAGQVRRQGQVAVGHHHLLEAQRPQMSDSLDYRSVEAAARRPHHRRTLALSPGRHLAVVAHHRHR